MDERVTFYGCPTRIKNKKVAARVAVLVVVVANELSLLFPVVTSDMKIAISCWTLIYFLFFLLV